MMRPSISQVISTLSKAPNHKYFRSFSASSDDDEVTSAPILDPSRVTSHDLLLIANAYVINSIVPNAELIYISNAVRTRF